MLAGRRLEAGVRLGLKAWIDDGKVFKDERERVLCDIASDSVNLTALKCVCWTDMSPKEINRFISGLIGNGYYATLANDFGMDILRRDSQ